MRIVNNSCFPLLFSNFFDIRRGEETVTQDYFKGLKYGSKISRTTGREAFLVYVAQWIRKEEKAMFSGGDHFPTNYHLLLFVF
jgi:hypothetical protein